MSVLEEKVLVSVCCVAFNHEKYIRTCLDGFVNQKTNFKYEVLVHDDASTDNTASIIKEYADKYPEIIKPILQKENQYSKGIWIYEEHLFPKCTGKYIAYCEGDDYWCDENKLQKQVDVLEKNPDYLACVHQTKMVNLRKNKESNFARIKENGLVEISKVFEAGMPWHLSSLMAKKEFLLKKPPFCFVSKQIQDYPLAVFLSLQGQVYFLKDVMSVYRRFTEGSWSIYNTSKPNLLLFREMREVLNLADEYSDYKYHKFMNKRISYFEYKLWRQTENLSILKNDRFKDLSMKHKIKLIFYILCREMGFKLR